MGGIDTPAGSAAAGSPLRPWLVGAEIGPSARRPPRLAAAVRKNLARSQQLGQLDRLKPQRRSPVKAPAVRSVEPVAFTK